VGLQQRLLSSIEAFARSLKVHRATVEKQWQKGRVAAADITRAGDKELELFTTPPGTDDERGEWTPEELEAEEATQIEAVTAAAEADVPIVLAGGEHSQALFNPTVAESLRAHGWRNVSVEVIANSGHQVIDEQPGAVADLLERYAAR
jgi:pimeloyl-ACP methyl ester carboxylesterase